MQDRKVSICNNFYKKLRINLMKNVWNLNTKIYRTLPRKLKAAWSSFLNLLFISKSMTNLSQNIGPLFKILKSTLSTATAWSQALTSLIWITTIPHDTTASQSDFNHDTNCVPFEIKTSMAFCLTKIKPKVLTIS